MSNRLIELFKKKNKDVLNVYCTAGFPNVDSTVEVMKALQTNGADIIELGMPYSDPLADGEVIQQSSTVALKNGISISLLFDQLKDVRKSIGLPVILMGYINPVLQYGFQAFCNRAAEVGVDALILPDLPMYEYETEYKSLLQQHNLTLIFLVTPETSEERIRKIDAVTSGFIYVVSSSSTTGNNKDIAEQQAYFKRLQEMKLKNPLLVGFGIKDKTTFRAASAYTNGAIIGSAYIKALQDGRDIKETTKTFLDSILK